MGKNIILPNGYKPNEVEPYMNELQLQYFKDKLLKWRQDLEKESQLTMEHLKQEIWNESDLNDRASVETDTAIELKSRDRYRKLMNKIDAALQRIESDNYGYCEETGEPIGLKRLEARPVAVLSIEAQERHERFERTHNDD